MGETEKPEPDFRDPYIEDQKHARECDVEKERIAQRDRADRREWWNGILAGIAVVLVVFGIIAGILYGVQRGQANDLKIEQEHTKVIHDCLDRGGSWMSGNCIYPGGAK